MSKRAIGICQMKPKNSLKFEFDHQVLLFKHYNSLKHNLIALVWFYRLIFKTLSTAIFNSQ